MVLDLNICSQLDVSCINYYFKLKANQTFAKLDLILQYAVPLTTE